MLRLVIAMTAALPLTCAAQNLSLNALSLNALTQKAFNQAIEKSPLLKTASIQQSILVCAIPLKEMRAGRSLHIDPIGKPAGPATFDNIARPAPIQACPAN